MILYDYICETCGSFSGWNQIDQSAQAVDCPNCNALSKRIITAPFLADMDPNNRIAHQRNEKSAHEPEVVSIISGSKEHHHDSKTHRHAHGHQRHNHGPSRPWMIGH